VITQELLYPLPLRQTALDILCLCKVKISLFATLSAVSGLLLAARPEASIGAALATGVFLMAAGAGALNHYQERHTDAFLPRTAGRPLPQGRINPRSALLLSVALISSGAAVLLETGKPWASFLGLTTVLWYNGFYTWLKARSSFAAVPGALVGAIVPAIGWVAGGGDIFDPRLAALCFFFFMWQILHFFIHVLAYGKEYEKAGLPSLSTSFTEEQLDRLCFQWLLASVVSTQFIVLFGVISLPLAHIVVIMASLSLAIGGLHLLEGPHNLYTRIFRQSNYYVLLVMLIMILDGLFCSPGSKAV
jgi:heme o synthase